MYLNRIFFSPYAYGVGKAAEQFFGVTDLNKLTVAQAATLAGMPQSPSAYNPVKHPEAAEKRRNIVLSLMKNKATFQKKTMTLQKQPLSARQLFQLVNIRAKTLVSTLPTLKK